MTRRANPSDDRNLIVGGMVTIAVVLFLWALVAAQATADVASGFIVGLCVVLVAYPVTRRVARWAGDPRLQRVFMAGLAVKLVASLARYFMIFGLYHGNGDSGVYDVGGWQWAASLAKHTGWPTMPFLSGRDAPTIRVAEFTGMIYTVTGRTRYGGFFIFATLCFFGTLLFLMAVRIAVPGVDFGRLTKLMLFWPPLLFWPSSIGKDALMVFALGLATLGGALLFGPRTRILGLIPAAGGVGILMLVRPNVALITLAASAAAIALLVVAVTGRQRAAGSRQLAIRMLLAVVTIVGVSVALSQAQHLLSDSAPELGVPSSSTGAATVDELDAAVNRTSIGNSRFSPETVRSPLDLPLAFPSVLFRPFPWEVHSVNALLGSLDGVMLATALALSWRRLRYLHHHLWQNPFLAFVAVYLVCFVVGFSNIANGAILARERSQMLPFVLILLALPVGRPGLNAVSEEYRGVHGGGGRRDEVLPVDRPGRPVGSVL